MMSLYACLEFMNFFIKAKSYIILLWVIYYIEIFVKVCSLQIFFGIFYSFVDKLYFLGIVVHVACLTGICRRTIWVSAFYSSSSDFSTLCTKTRN